MQSVLASLLVGCASLIAIPLASAQAPTPAEQAAEQQELLGIAAPFGDFSIGFGPDGYTLGLSRAGQHVGDLNVARGRSGPPTPRLGSAHYRFTLWNNVPDESVLEPLSQAADAIAAADGGALPPAGRIQPRPPIWEPLAWAAAIALAAGCVMGAWRRFKTSLDVRKPHVVQACVHTSIFVYWSLYWPGVRDQVPMILLMIALAYGADAAFSFGRFGSWRVGLSPLPVVFSTNLFVWLDARGAVIAMVGAFATKTFVQREGKHVFNPSVAGLTLTAACTILFPDFVHFGGLFHTLNMAPNMAEWVFLGSLVPLAMFRLSTVSIGCVLGLLYVTHTTGALRPTLLLMMTLLATDPATTPKSDLGRVLFGLVVGVSYPLYSMLLHRLGQPDDFAKILSVPIPNLIAPWIDRLTAYVEKHAEQLRATWWPDIATRLGDRAASVSAFAKRLQPIPNGVLVAVWAILFIVPLYREKPLDFEPALHWDWDTPNVVRGASGVPRCEDNPVFCTPFSFIGEARLWLDRGSTPHGEPPR